MVIRLTGSTASLNEASPWTTGMPRGGRSYRDWLRLDPCVYCGRRPDEIRRGKHGAMTLEHIVPSSCGGGNGWDNLAAACYTCNGRRSSTSLLVYLVQARPLKPGKHRRARMGRSEARLIVRQHWVSRRSTRLTFRPSWPEELQAAAAVDPVDGGSTS